MMNASAHNIRAILMFIIECTHYSHAVKIPARLVRPSMAQAAIQSRDAKRRTWNNKINSISCPVKLHLNTALWVPCTKRNATEQNEPIASRGVMCEYWIQYLCVFRSNASISFMKISCPEVCKLNETSASMSSEKHMRRGFVLRATKHRRHIKTHVCVCTAANVVSQSRHSGQHTLIKF